MRAMKLLGGRGRIGRCDPSFAVGGWVQRSFSSARRSPPAPDRFAETLRTRARIKARLAPQLAAALASSS